MIIKNNVNLRDYNTLHIETYAENFYGVENNSDLLELFNIIKDKNYILLGGGSNTLFSKAKYNNVIYIDTKGIEIVEENDNFVDIRVAAGEEWHSFLLYLLKNKLYGLENLALIPGKCGAAPIQNIGAYGIEQEKCFLKAELFDLDSREYTEIYKDDCNFGYRSSIFKTNEFKKYIISNVVYRLERKFNPNLHYNELKKLDASNLIAETLFNYICQIRKSKIPYPDEVGTAGSFFKNPIIDKEKLELLQREHPNIPHYAFNTNYKLSAAWLIESCGMKGKRLNDISDASISPRHSLVITNLGKANGNELLELSMLVIERVYLAFAVKLEAEVNIV
ncbi:MAG TPA: UDP-N-acetylmuramate dehydrogenase [Candidatus Kapabacteria bacterium]|nr:UDP-N-acetylmuramate dehydrogenase [Candidatus Kapabacteria bacterium]